MPKPTIEWSWLIDTLEQNRTTNISKFLEVQNVKYILLDGNLIHQQTLENLLYSFSSQENLVFSRQVGRILVFTNQASTSKVIPQNHVILIQGGISTLTSLNNQEEFNPSDFSVLFTDQNPEFLPQFLPAANTLIFEGNPSTRFK